MRVRILRSVVVPALLLAILSFNARAAPPAENAAPRDQA